MAESAYLNGKVLARTLPSFRLPLEGAVPTLKRLFLPQGELAQVYDQDEGIRYIAWIELLAGQSRGNHYHKVKKELVYVVQGEVVLWAGDINSDARATVTLRAGDVATIETGIAHALQTIQPGHAIEFSTARFDAADIYPFRLT